MRFEDLSTDVLAKILDGELSWSSILLWQTGCHQLMSKLANGGVRHMELVDSNEFVAASFPKCLKHFKLLSLSISQGFGFVSIDGVHNELRRQHAGLEKLELNFPGALKSIFPTSESTPLRTLEVDDPSHFDYDDDDEDDEDGEKDDNDSPYKEYEAEDGETVGDMASRLGITIEKGNAFYLLSKVRINVYSMAIMY